MSLDLTQSLNALAMGQAMLVAPALGEDYTGKTAGSIAFLLFVLANGLDARMAQRPVLAARLEALLADAPAACGADPLVAAALADAAAGPANTGAGAGAGAGAAAVQRFDLLMGALAALHAWADSHDAALAARCRAFLLDWAAIERLDIPALPG
jgi:hypothetical protein